jgi:uncharacterized protein with FMN-binding domain
MLRRIALLATGTVGGVVAIVAYHPPQLHAVAATGVVSPTPQQSTSPSATTTGTTNSTSTAKPAPSTPTPKTSSGVFTGDVARTQWGPVQVQITVSAGQITKVSALQFPHGDQRSRSISQQSVPYLISQTISIKSANVVGVSGASYTSDGWRRSLASARAKAGI